MNMEHICLLILSAILSIGISWYFYEKAQDELRIILKEIEKRIHRADNGYWKWRNSEYNANYYGLRDKIHSLGKQMSAVINKISKLESSPETKAHIAAQSAADEFFGN